MEVMWKLVAEVLVRPGDLPSGVTKAFVPVTTWADSADLAGEKLCQYLESFEWHVISIEAAEPVDETRDYGEEVEDMIERTRTNPKAIILGTFNSYKDN